MKKTIRRKNKPLSHRLSDSITSFVGSWAGFIFHIFVIISWMSYNVLFPSKSFDPFPFIFLNLALSTEAAISACFVLMSQNRAADRDRKTLEESYVANLETKLSLAEIADKLEKLESLIKRVGKNVKEEEKD